MPILSKLKEGLLRYAWLLLIGVSLLLHRPIFTTEIQGTHAWRQSQTAWNIRNFCRHEDNILNTRVSHFNNNNDNLYRYEFPLMQWGIGMSQKLVGESVLVIRIWMFAIGLLALLGFYRLARLFIRDPAVAFLSVVAFNFAPVFYYYTMNPLPDLFALCMGIWYLYFFVKTARTDAWAMHIAAAICLSLATLSKLPFIVFGGATFVLLLAQLFDLRSLFKARWWLKVSIYLLCIAPALAWYAWVIPTWKGNGIVSGVLDNPISWARAFDILRYHAHTMFPYILMSPIYLPFLATAAYFYIRKRWFASREVLALSFAGLLVVAYFLFELNMIEKVHDYYMFPFLPFLFLGIAAGIQHIWKAFPKAPIAIALAILVVAPAHCLWLNRHSWHPSRGWQNADLYTYREALQKAVPHDEPCIILNDPSSFIFSYAIDKQGYIFNNDHLPTEWIVDLIMNRRLKYMYSDSRAVDERADVRPLLDSMLLDAGSIHVWQLKSPEEAWAVWSNRTQ